jgi:hypothetical protein
MGTSVTTWADERNLRRCHLQLSITCFRTTASSPPYGETQPQHWAEGVALQLHIPSGWPMEEESPALFILGWTLRGLATASATASLGPRLDSSIFRGDRSHRCLLIGSAPSAGGVVTANRPQHLERRRPCHQIFAPGPLSCRWTQGATYGRILEAIMLVGECPGVMVTAAR